MLVTKGPFHTLVLAPCEQVKLEVWYRSTGSVDISLFVLWAAFRGTFQFDQKESAWSRSNYTWDGSWELAQEVISWCRQNIPQASLTSVHMIQAKIPVKIQINLDHGLQDKKGLFGRAYLHLDHASMGSMVTIHKRVGFRKLKEASWGSRFVVDSDASREHFKTLIQTHQDVIQELWQNDLLKGS